MTAAPSQALINGLSAGLIAGIRTILGTAAMVTLILPGSLSAGTAQAIEVLLIGGVAVGAIVAMMSTYPGTVAQVQDGPAVILGVMGSTIAAAMPGEASVQLVLLAVLASANVAALAAGVVFYFLGAYRLGALVRFIPFPVIGGFLAGSGLLILLGAGRVLTGVDIAHASVAVLLEPMRVARWLPGLAFGLLMLWMLRRFSHVLLVPGMLFGGVLLYHGLAFAFDVPDAKALAAGWLLGPFPEGGGLHLPAWTRIPPEGWSLLLTQAPTFAAIILVSVVALLLNASGLELATRSDLDINRELRAAGVANMAAGVLGGAVGFHALSASLLGARMGSNTKWIGLTAAAMCAAALIAGTAALGYVPKALLGGLLLTMGLGLLIEWLYDGWFKLPLLDYMIVALIVAVIGGVGILAGVAVGVTVAMAIFVLSYSRVRVIRQELSGADYRSSVERSPAALDVLKEKGGAIHIIKLEGFIFFGTAYTVFTHIQALTDPNSGRTLRHLLLDFRDVPASDSSAMSAFAKIHSITERCGCELICTRMHADVERQFRQAGLDPALVRISFYDDLDVALEHCEEKILDEHKHLSSAGGSTIWDSVAKALPKDVPIASFMAYLESRSYAPGDTLMKQGDPASEIIFIESGRVTIRLAFDDGRTIRLRSLTTGTMIGEIGVYLNQPRTASVVADHDTKAFILSREQLNKMEQNDPALANALHYTIVALQAERLAGVSRLLERLIN